MAGYRRFIAYVYEYRKEKKHSGCGFVKVEAREDRCIIEVHLHCPGLPPQISCSVYGFVRKDGLMNGILLGTCETEENALECTIETDTQNMGGSGISLERMGGLLFLTETGGFFGTEWDDQPIRPANFRELPAKQPEYAVPVQNEIPKMPDRNTDIPQTPVSDDARQEINIPDSDYASQTSPENFQNDSTENTETPAVDDIQQNVTGYVPEYVPKHSSENLWESNSRNPAVQNSGDLQQDSMDSDLLNPMAQTPDEAQQDSVHTLSPSFENSVKDSTENSEAQSQETIQENTAPNPSEAIYRTASEAFSSKAGTQQDTEHGKRPGSFGEFFPFEDGSFETCRKIHLCDLSRLSVRNVPLRGNRFLQYGHYNFGHLLLARRADGQYILGVPGGYGQQEHFMANMFGFPYFKESRYITLPNARGGYWYRLIDPPNSH